MFSPATSEDQLTIKNESLSQSPLSQKRSDSGGSRASLESPADLVEERKDGMNTMDSRQYALRWRHHKSTVVSEVAFLYQDSALVDVTLACEDQRTFEAHKLVLSACSQYFQSLFSRYPDQQHPIIFLKDVNGDECEALLTYMYRGEVSVSQDQISDILKVATSLQVRGLAETETHSRPNTPTPGAVEIPNQTGSSSPSLSTGGPPTKCVSPASEPQSPTQPSLANNPTTFHNSLSSSHSTLGPTDVTSSSATVSSRIALPPPHPRVLPPDFPAYHSLLPHRSPYDMVHPPGPIIGPLDPERGRPDPDKGPPAGLGPPFAPQLRVKPDLGSSNSWMDESRGLSPLSMGDGPRPHLFSHAIFSSFLPDQHVTPQSQPYGRMGFPISDPLRRSLSSTAGDTRIHKCTYCARKFKRKDHLKTHIRIHTGERPYKCRVCGRGFIQSQQVKIHMKVHTREDTGNPLGLSTGLGGVPSGGGPLSALYPELAASHPNDLSSRGLNEHHGSLHFEGGSDHSSSSLHNNPRYSNNGQSSRSCSVGRNQDSIQRSQDSNPSEHRRSAPPLIDAELDLSSETPEECEYEPKFEPKFDTKEAVMRFFPPSSLHNPSLMPHTTSSIQLPAPLGYAPLTSRARMSPTSPSHSGTSRSGSRSPSSNHAGREEPASLKDNNIQLNNNAKK